MFKSRLKRKLRIRGKIRGTKEQPRLTVFRSNKTLYAQIINDDTGTTEVSFKGERKNAATIGQELAKLALKKKISKVVFDRNGYQYHGTIQILADGAREGGLKF